MTFYPPPPSPLLVLVPYQIYQHMWCVMLFWLTFSPSDDSTPFLGHLLNRLVVPLEIFEIILCPLLSLLLDSQLSSENLPPPASTPFLGIIGSFFLLGIFGISIRGLWHASRCIIKTPTYSAHIWCLFHSWLNSSLFLYCFPPLLLLACSFVLYFLIVWLHILLIIIIIIIMFHNIAEIWWLALLTSSSSSSSSSSTSSSVNWS